MFSQLRGRVHRRYDTYFVDRASETLVLAFSPHPRLALRDYPFRHDTLHIADRKLGFYLHKPAKQVQYLATFLLRAGYKKAVFIGSSKGGTGAILWAALLKQLKPKSNTFAIAFSPQIKLYPFNRNLLSIPSYVRIMTMANDNLDLLASLKKYGDLPSLLCQGVPPTLVVYGRRSKMDTVEAGKLGAYSEVTRQPLEISFHGSLIPFVTDLSNRSAIEKIARKLHIDATKDEDLKATNTLSSEALASELSELRCLSLNDLIDQFIAREEQEPEIGLVAQAVRWLKSWATRALPHSALVLPLLMDTATLTLP